MKKFKYFFSDSALVISKHSHPYMSYMSNERWQGEELFQSKNHVLEMPPSHAKMRLKTAPQKLNFLMAKGIQKSYALNDS